MVDIVLNHNLNEEKMNKIKNLKKIETLKFEKDEIEQNNIVFLKENQNLKNTIELANNEKEQLVADIKNLHELDKNDLIEKISQYEEQNKKYNEKIVDLEGNIKVLEELNEKFRNEVESFKKWGYYQEYFINNIN